MTDVLTLTGVSKVFPSHRAVDNVNLTIPPGEFHALVGPSGCGKTTTLRMVAGFEIPTEGNILLEGANVASLPPYARNVSTVFQNYALFPHLTIRQNVEFGLKRKSDPGNIPAKVAEVLDLVQLTGKEDRLPSQLSGGEKQRAALARSLALAPAVLLLDEPLSALDPNLRKQVRLELKALQRRVGITFLMVTHDQEEALTLADRITVMNKGKVEQTGTPHEIYLKPRTPFVAQFLGAMNWLNGFGLRPEATRITPLEPPSGVPSVRATVLDSTFLGNCIHVLAEMPNGETITVEVSRFEGTHKQGDRVQLWWNPEDELRFS
ncbi:MAG: ABC transporter ATP-binding protein [Acidobacteria bacterium]|nr:ABC transporter ATP-binding protein [Acidobacteriota bacterium]